ncbi:hypothetical protein [Nocardiopsis composta]|uniref:Uncharacterized protein n=1 Tax=Nocardiopsis composta TaxID=157465 RepID=A0A7W8VEI0_9ACTN|nr:hypothetical protein [Nocardiopsis composta]MBB5433103.1 hypothetical protein [Nocardiopsis composta]HLU72976.1 hypothetical protein [Nonomuraea sp.]
MKRIAAASGLLAATALALGAMTGTASADNNAEVQNITVPVCVDLLAASGKALDGCSKVDVHTEEGTGVQ